MLSDNEQRRISKGLRSHLKPQTAQGRRIAAMLGARTLGPVRKARKRKQPL